MPVQEPRFRIPRVKPKREQIGIARTSRKEKPNFRGSRYLSKIKNAVKIKAANPAKASAR